MKKIITTEKTEHFVFTKDEVINALKEKYNIDFPEQYEIVGFCVSPFETFSIKILTKSTIEEKIQIKEK